MRGHDLAQLPFALRIGDLLRNSAGRGGGQRCVRQRRAADVLGDARRVDDGFEQRVRRQAVGAMRAGRGDFARRPQSIERGAAARVGRDAAHVIVRGGRDRNEIARRIDAGAAAVLRYTPGKRCAKLAPIALRASRNAPRPACNLGEHAARHDIARRELGVGMDFQHEALARRVDEPSRLRRGSLRSRAAPDRGRCRSRSDGTARTPDRRSPRPRAPRWRGRARALRSGWW